jgi:hypothetical protein
MRIIQRIISLHAKEAAHRIDTPLRLLVSKNYSTIIMTVIAHRFINGI